jgi:hypothetical protein
MATGGMEPYNLFFFIAYLLQAHGVLVDELADVPAEVLRRANVTKGFGVAQPEPFAEQPPIVHEEMLDVLEVGGLVVIAEEG